MHILTATIRGIAKEPGPRRACKATSSIRTCRNAKGFFVCPVSHSSLSPLRGGLRFQMGIWEYLSPLAEHIKMSASPPPWGVEDRASMAVGGHPYFWVDSVPTGWRPSYSCLWPLLGDACELRALLKCSLLGKAFPGLHSIQYPSSRAC